MKGGALPGVDEVLTALNGLFFDPSKRVFIGYLGLAAVIGAVVWVCRGRAWQHYPRALFSRRIWWSPSARADYRILAINQLLFLFLAPWLLSQMTLATWVFEHLHYGFNVRPTPGLNWPAWTVPVLFTLTLFLLDDFARFWIHRLMHRIPWLWAFHQVHHSARVLTPLTVLRTHPVEGVLFSLRSALVNGVCIGIFVFFFDNRVDLILVFGSNVCVFLFNVAGSNLRHSHCYWRYPAWLERWLISPAQHQIHHSAEPRHFDRNFGAVLAIWDRLFGSLLISEPTAPKRFGVTRRLKPAEQSLVVLYWRPFVMAARSLGRWVIPNRFGPTSGRATAIQQVDKEGRAHG